VARYLLDRIICDHIGDISDILKAILVFIMATPKKTGHATHRAHLLKGNFEDEELLQH
jgi:hypothetical protein